MASPHSGLEMSDLGDIYHATMGCISRFEACLLVKPLMNGGWAESRLADMRLWASGVGALASPQASLDRRLQYQPKARLVLTNLLLTLDEFIKSCHLLALGESHHNRLDDEAESKYAPVSSKEGALESAHGNDSVHAPSSLSWFATLGSDQKTASGASTDSEAGDDAEEGSETTLEDAIKDIEDILDQLIILGFAIRKSGTVARLQRADRSFKPNENSDLQRHLEFILRNDTAKRRKRGEENGEITTNDRMQWSEVDFGEAVTRQQKHLIQANLRRRHRFGYARRHQQKLDQPVTQPLVTRPGPISPVGDHRPPALDADPQSLPTEDSPSKNLPTDPPENLQAPETRATTPSTAKGDILKMAIPSQAAASRVSVSVANIHYPSPPPISNQVGFRCPCCYQTLPGMFKDWSRWRKHIAEDLCPYTCPFPECPRPEVLYISRAAWRDHVLETHGAGKYWECLACSGTGVPNRFSTAEQFAGHNRAWHKDTISEDQVAGLQTLCQKTEPPNIAHCPLCPWPQDEEAVPDAAANLEHVGNCIHEFSLSALPWAESSDAEFATVRAPASTKVQEWFDMTSEEIEDTEETEDDDIQKIDIRTVDIQAIDIKLFGILPMPPRRNKPENPYIPEEYFAESSRESSQVERGSRTVDSDLPEVRGTYSDDTQLDPLVPSSIETGSVVEPEMLEFAIETTKMLRGAALRLMSEGSERGERRYTSSLATQLHIISEYLETTNFAGIPHARARIANLLCTYERLCTMPRRLPETVPRSSSSQFDRKSYPTIDLLLKHKTPQSIFEKTLKNLTTRHGSANGAEIFRLLRKFPPTDGKSDIQTLEKPHRFSTYLVVMHSALFNRHSCSHPAPLYMYIQLNSMQLRRESFEEAVTIDAVFQDHTAPGHSVAASPQSLVDVHIGVRLSSSDNTNTGLETGLPVSSLCDIIIMGRRQKSQLHLEVSNSLLWMEPLTSLKPSALPGRSISLAEVIKGFRLSTRMRVLLSYTLAKATWQFYDTPWMLQGWTKDSIYFLSNRTAGIANEVYINEPFLFTNFETSNRTPDRYRHLSSHRFPKILAFGIMLLEIELGTHLEDHQNHTGTDPIGKPTANADHIAAMEMFHKIEDSFSVVRDVIKHCLDATIFYPFGDDIQGLCDTFYSNIVSKLRALYEVVWGDPDTSDILPIRLNSLVVSHLQATEESSRPSSQLPVSSSSTSLPAETVFSSPGFPSDAWFQRLDRLNAILRLDRLNAILRLNTKEIDESYRPVKIAILDTGVSDDLKDLVKGYKDFVDRDNDDDDLDNVNHGNNAVRLMLRVYNKAEIYLCRIASGPQAKIEQASRVAEAVRHAQNEWNVDIITMAFGFEGDKSEIWRAIDEAHRAGILIFAAASGSGTFGQVDFPGYLHAYSKLIFWMFSTDAFGQPSSFNPSPIPSARYNFAILGEDIRLRPDSEGISGTSFATMIGAGIASCLLDFSRQKDSMERIRHIGGLQTVEGMSAVFEKMSIVGNGYHCMVPGRILSREVAPGEPTLTMSGERAHICEMISRALEDM